MVAPWYLPARRELEIPRRRPLELPALPRLERRPALAIPARIQNATAAPVPIVGPNLSISLGSALTIGSMLFAIFARSDGAGQGPIVVSCGAATMTWIASAQAHTNGSTTHLYYRKVVAGDSNTITSPVPGGTWGAAAAEFSGVSANLVGGVVTGAINTPGPVMGLTVAQGAAAFVIAAFCTRMDPCSWTPNGSTNNLGLVGGSSGGVYDGSEFGWGIGNITIGGTQTGSARNAGFPWNGVAQAFAPLDSLAFVGDPGGAVW